MKNNKQHYRNRGNNHGNNHGHKPTAAQREQMEIESILRDLIPMLEASADTVTISRDEYNLLIGGMALLDVILTMANGGRANYEIGNFVLMLNDALKGKGES